MKNSKTIAGLTIASLMILSLCAGAIGQIILSNTNVTLVISVTNLPVDSKGTSTTYYVIKDPFNETKLELIDSTTLYSNRAQFSLSAGTYSISAFNPNFGWDANIINLTSSDNGKSIALSLKLKPVAQNWTNLSGVKYDNLMTSPAAANKVTSNKSSSDEIAPMLSDFPILVYYHDYPDIPIKVGELHSALGTSVGINLKYSSSVETVSYIDLFGLSVKGYTTRTQSTSVELGPVSNCDDKQIMGTNVIEYQIWAYINEPWMYEEDWVQEQMNTASLSLQGPTPNSYYKSIDDRDNTIDARNAAAQVTLDFGQMQGQDWGIDAATSITDAWMIFSGTVTLGGSFSFSNTNSNDVIYTINVNQGHVIYLYDFSGGLVTMQNDYWAADSWGGTISGGGYASNVDGVQGPFYDGSFGEIHCSSSGDAAYIKVQLSGTGIGDIYVWAYEPAYYQSSHIYVYTSYDGTNWNPAGNFYASYSGGQQFFYCGTSWNWFNYISFAGYYDNGYPIDFHIERVHVIGST